MTKKSDKIELTHMRRSDRSQDEAWIAKFLETAPFLVIAISTENEPFVTCTNFAYINGKRRIYLHSSPSAQLHKYARNNPRVSVMAAEMGRLLESQSAGGLSVEYGSVIARGKLGLVVEADEATMALNGLIQKYFSYREPGKHFSPIKPSDLAATSVYSIEITEWSGKANQADSDFSGAIRYHQGYFSPDKSDSRKNEQ